MTSLLASVKCMAVHGVISANVSAAGDASLLFFFSLVGGVLIPPLRFGEGRCAPHRDTTGFC